MSFLSSRIWHRNWALFVVPLAVPVVIALSFAIAGGPALWIFTVPVLEPDLTGPAIPYDHLASEATDPYSFHGYIS